ncbi:PAS domain S-box protein [Natrinema sp. 1APR25-10V2]|uniref:PAS domain-containing sensor histidine kinase n=1 Tax=Natrinema sp. 1APR25-10V2 TaxID=2951081 RepID=UPI0028770C5C|nr:PAS domain S-box protein [Natrinema sp. 1APR25-10V2]MDS0476922.1 PAS domain S-box protein [Natrinema sp. 1APR25-10V2]
MGFPGSAPDVTREEVRGVFTQFEQPATPITAGDVADTLDCPRQSARQRLEHLADSGELQTRQLGEGTQVWWRPESKSLPDQPDREEFASFVSAVKDYAIFMLDPDGTVASWNEGAERIKGYQEDEIVGEHFSTFYTDTATADGVPERNLEAAAEAGRTEDEGWRVRKDGTRFWAHVTITAIRDADGTLRGFTKVTRDMTERREYEQQLRQERDLTEQILETVPVSICVLARDGEFVRANQRMLDRIGSDKAELPDYSVDSWEIYDADDKPIPVEEWPWTQVIETGDPVYDYRCQVELPDLGRRWLSLNAAPLDGEKYDEQQVVVAVDDITEQKEREQQLRRQYSQTEQLLRTAPVAIAVQDADGETVLANQRAQDLLGLSEQEFIEEPEDIEEWTVYDADGDPISPDETPSARVLATGEPVLEEELTIDPPNSDPIQFRINAAPLFGSDGEIDRVVTAGKDITALKEREQQLEQRKTELETELNEILGRISDAFYAIDDEWRFTHLNEQAADIMQQSREELLGRNVWDVFPEATEGVYWEELQTAMETQEPVSFNVYEEELDAWFEFNVYPSESGLSVYFRDVTDRVEHEQELAKYETIVETIDDGIYVKDEDGYFTMVNEAYAELTGYTREELVGAHASLVVDEATIEQSQERLAAPDEQIGTPTMEAEIQTAEGNRVPAEGTFATLQTGDTQEEIGVVRDITDRKRREQALREREHRLKRYKEYTDKILDAIDDVFYLLDEDGDLQRWNESLSAVTGFSSTEIESMHALEFFGEADQETIAAAIEDGFTTGQTQVEADVRTKDGEHIPYEFVASTLEDPDGNMVLAGIGRDITDRREYERQLEESNERLEQFAYAASHDLQEPLRMITSYLQLIENRYADELDEDAEEFIEFAVDGADRMQEMIEGLLQYSRVETQGDPFEPVDLDKVLEDTLENLQMAIEESSAEITVDALPEVHGDHSQLQQVFQNLISNAIEYSGDEPPQIHIDAEQYGSEYIIAVHDKGIGIDPEEQDRIFQVFQRLHSHEEHPGTGIGLALCQRIVERHGGEIWVDSEPGEGTTFSFTLSAA